MSIRKTFGLSGSMWQIKECKCISNKLGAYNIDITWDLKHSTEWAEKKKDYIIKYIMPNNICQIRITVTELKIHMLMFTPQVDTLINWLAVGVLKTHKTLWKRQTENAVKHQYKKNNKKRKWKCHVNSSHYLFILIPGAMCLHGHDTVRRCQISFINLF